MPGLRTLRKSTAAGGGAFTLPSLTMGVFLCDQPDHRFALGGDRAERVPLVNNQGWLLPKGAEGLCEYDTPLDVLYVSFDDSLLADAGLNRADTLSPVVGALDPLLLQLALASEAADAAPALYRDTMAQAAAAHLARLVAPAPATGAAVDDRRLRRAVSFIHDNLAEDLSLDAIAREAAMSPYHFSRVFKATLGASPLQYVIAARIDRARVLLRTTKLTVAEIAWRVGYEDVSRFGRHFKRQVGATPAAYRDG